jgi:predicted N-acetyltransferase YhbS
LFREATLADVAAITSLINAAYKPRDGMVFPGDRVTADEIAEIIAGEESVLVVLESNGTIAATARLDIDPPDAGFGLLATSVSHQGRGLAPALIAECERRAIASGCTAMRIGIIDKVGLRPYYEALGYRYTGETPGEELSWGQHTLEPFAYVAMEKPLR